MRLDSGLDHFRESGKEFSIHEMKHRVLNNVCESNRKIRDEDFK